MSLAVYFIKNETTGAIKIGRTKTMRKRLGDLQTASSEPLTLLGVVPGSNELERALHTEFRDHQIHGEWFHPHESLMSRIATMISDGEPNQIEDTKKQPDEFTLRAAHWLNEIEVLDQILWHKAAHRARIAEMIGVPQGTLENIRRLRVEHITSDDFDKIRIAFTKRMQVELDLLCKELERAKAEQRLSQAQFDDTEAHLSMARALLNAGAPR